MQTKDHPSRSCRSNQQQVVTHESRGGCRYRWCGEQDQHCTWLGAVNVDVPGSSNSGRLMCLSSLFFGTTDGSSCTSHHKKTCNSPDETPPAETPPPAVPNAGRLPGNAREQQAPWLIISQVSQRCSTLLICSSPVDQSATLPHAPLNRLLQPAQEPALAPALHVCTQKAGLLGYCLRGECSNSSNRRARSASVRIDLKRYRAADGLLLRLHAAGAHDAPNPPGRTALQSGA